MIFLAICLIEYCNYFPGIILSSGTPLLRANDIQYRLNASGAKCIITNAACAEYVDEVNVSYETVI